MIEISAEKGYGISRPTRTRNPMMSRSSLELRRCVHHHERYAGSGGFHARFGILKFFFERSSLSKNDPVLQTPHRFCWLR